MIPDVPHAQFNVKLLTELRPAWEAKVQPDTSMFRLLFTPNGTRSYMAPERVVVEYETDQKVQVHLSRMVPRPREADPAGSVVVTADYVRPENAGPVVESFLMQLQTDDG